MMNLRMTPTAQRQKVFQSVISGFLRRGHAVSINVVNVQIVFAAAMLACVLVALQGSFAVAAKEGIVFVLLAHGLVVLWICGKPLMNAAHVELALTFRATVLYAGLKNKVIAATRALLNGAFQRTASSNSFGLFCRFSLRLFELSRAASTGFLRCTCGRVSYAANDTLPINEPNAGLPVSFQSARLTAPHVGRSLVNDCTAVWASQFSVFAHSSFRIKNERILTQVR